MTKEQMNTKILNHITGLALAGEPILEVNDLTKNLLVVNNNPSKIHPKLEKKMSNDLRKIRVDIGVLISMTNAVLNNPLTWMVSNVTL